MFPDLGPNQPPPPLNQVGTGACRGILDQSPLYVFSRDADIQTTSQVGQAIFITRPVKAIEFNFNIGIYCGCGGVDGLGVPLKNNPDTIHVEFAIP